MKFYQTEEDELNTPNDSLELENSIESLVKTPQEESIQTLDDEETDAQLAGDLAENAKMVDNMSMNQEDMDVVNELEDSTSEDQMEIAEIPAVENVVDQSQKSATETQQKPQGRLGTYNNILENYKALREAQNLQNERLSNANYLFAGNQIAQGIALRSGAKIGAGEQAVNAFRKDAEVPVEQAKDNIKFGNEQELADPSSAISGFYRDQAKAVLMRLYPKRTEQELSDTLADLSALQISQIPGLKNALGGSQRTIQQAQFIVKSSGDPVKFDPNTGEYRNAVTNELVQSGDIVRPIAYTDAFGNRQYVSPSGNITVQSSVRPNVSEETLNKTASEFKPDKAQRDALDKEKERLDLLNKTSNTQLSQMNNLVETIKSNSKISKGVVLNALARASGEVGALTEGDKAPFAGSQALLDRIEQYIQTNVDSTLTDSNKNEINNLIKIYTQTINEAKKNIFNSSATSLAEIHNIPPQFTRKAIPDVKPLTSSQKELVGENKLVKVKAPSGKIAEVTEEKAKEYLKRPGYERVK